MVGYRNGPKCRVFPLFQTRAGILWVEKPRRTLLDLVDELSAYTRPVEHRLGDTITPESREIHS